jgi:uncharacterized protein
MTDTTHLVLAARFFAAIESGDVATVEALYHPDARIWHNTDGLKQTRDQNMAVLRWMLRTLRAVTYDVGRRDALPDGFVQQHVLRAILPSGEALAMPACIVAKVEGEAIIRLDEYLDGRATDALSSLTR